MYSRSHQIGLGNCEAKKQGHGIAREILDREIEGDDERGNTQRAQKPDASNLAKLFHLLADSDRDMPGCHADEGGLRKAFERVARFNRPKRALRVAKAINAIAVRAGRLRVNCPVYGRTGPAWCQRSASVMSAKIAIITGSANGAAAATIAVMLMRMLCTVSSAGQLASTSSCSVKVGKPWKSAENGHLCGWEYHQPQSLVRRVPTG